MNSKHQLILAIIAIPLVACGAIAWSAKPAIEAWAESYRWSTAEDMIERRMWQQTEYQAELAERENQAPQNEAAKATAYRTFMLGVLACGLMVVVGWGYYQGKSRIRAAHELPPTRKIDNGLMLVGGAIYDRYSGMQVLAGQSTAPSLEHAQAYAIARGSERDGFVRLGYRALEVLPTVVSMLRNHDIEPPIEAELVLDALPDRREHV